MIFDLLFFPCNEKQIAPIRGALR